MQMYLLGLLLFLVGIGIGYGGYWLIARRKVRDANSRANQILNDATKEAEAKKKEYLLQAKDEMAQQKKEMENEFKERENKLKKQEDRLQNKEERVESKQEQINRKESELKEMENRLSDREEEIQNKQRELEEKIRQQDSKLQEISGLTREQAKERLLSDLESEVRHESAKRIRQIESEARETADRKAKEVLADAIQRYAGDYVSDQTVAAVELPSDEMKGRIIGREGRNIRSFESATGVDLIIDDTPQTVILSAYSPLRRAKAKQVLERLITDGRIHPARIEDVAEKVEKEMEVKLREIGEKVTFDVGVHGIHSEMIRLLGHLNYRTSFSQNVLDHSLEVAFLCGIMAAELKMDFKKAKRAGLLHDVGKAVDHDVEGPHATIGANLAKKHGESKDIVHAIEAHHEDVQAQSILAILVQASDSLSGARPGARKELLENYVKRLEELENVATAFEGVSKAYAIQAGRELRVMIDCDQVDEDQTYMVCRDIAHSVEEKLTYPGQIKVTCIREKRSVEYAK